jgi:hypothetical protein
VWKLCVFRIRHLPLPRLLLDGFIYSAASILMAHLAQMIYFLCPLRLIPAAADLNNDGVINVLDLGILAEHYDKSGSLLWQ